MAADTCRLCLRPIDKAKSSNLLTETTKFAMLKEFLPDMNLDISENTEVCNNCMGELETSYNYKNGVVANEANIQAKLKGKKQKKIDLKLMLDGVAKKELKKGDHICRTCLSICKSPSISLFDSPSNMMPYSFVKEMCEAVFELEFIASAKPVLCDDCWETLQTVYNFRKSCLRIDQRLRTYVASKNVKKLSIDEFKKFAEENPVKEEDEDSSDEEINGYIKDEPIDEEELKIDPEEASCSSSSVKVKDETEVKSESELNSDDEDMEDEPDLLDPKALKSEASEPDGEDCKMEIGDVKVDTEGEGAAGTSGEKSTVHTHHYQNKTRQPLYDVPDIPFRHSEHPHLIHSLDLKEQLISQSDDTPASFSCAQCSFETTALHNFKRHKLVHRTVKMFSCAHCSFTTKLKESLKRHLITHQSSGTGWTFSCAHCSFTTKYRNSLKHHLITHQSSGTERTFSCANCAFTTKHKSSLKHHLKTHRQSDRVQLVSCTHCSFTTNFRKYLKYHMVTHQPKDTIQMFSCAVCDFTAIRKDSLRRHFITHQPKDALQMFSCVFCSYTTKRKYNLKSHLITHEPNRAVQTFSCANCSFTTIHKRSLQPHLITHQPDGREMVSCRHCSFTTKYKTSLKHHMITHQPTDTVQIFSCTVCSYTAKRKKNLKRHQITHLPDCSVQTFSCAHCSFTSKHKASLQRHLIIHQP